MLAGQVGRKIGGTVGNKTDFHNTRLIPLFHDYQGSALRSKQRRQVRSDGMFTEMGMPEKFPGHTGGQPVCGLYCDQRLASMQYGRDFQIR